MNLRRMRERERDFRYGGFLTHFILRHSPYILSYYWLLGFGFGTFHFKYILPDKFKTIIYSDFIPKKTGLAENDTCSSNGASAFLRLLFTCRTKKLSFDYRSLYLQ